MEVCFKGETRRIVASVKLLGVPRDLVILVADGEDGFSTWFCDGRIGSLNPGEPSGDYDIISVVSRSFNFDLLDVFVKSESAAEAISCAVDLTGMSSREVADKAGVSTSLVSDLFSGTAKSIPLVDAVRIERRLSAFYYDCGFMDTGEVISLVSSDSARGAVVSMMSHALSFEDISDLSQVSVRMIRSIVDNSRSVIPFNVSVRLCAANVRLGVKRRHPASSLSRSRSFQRAREILLENSEGYNVCDRGA